MRNPEVVLAAFLAGLFGLIPLIVQIVSTRAQRKDRMTRLNHLRAELELLERIHTLQGQVGARDEAAKPQTKLVVSDRLSNLLDQYKKLSEIAPSTIVGGKQPSPQQLSFFRRAFLLYNPRTTSGWILHTLFYMFSIIFWFMFLVGVFAIGWEFGIDDFFLFAGVFLIPIGIALLIIQRFARRNAARNATQLEEPNA
jgi:hypothetical protein